MISFPCKCGQIIEVADDQAGLTIQCPHCGLLRDIPTLSDLSHLTDDGTYDLEPSQRVTEEHRIDQVRRAFSPERMDDEGGEIDLRPTMSDVKRAGYIEEVQDDKAPLIPKYDPVTGELVETIRVQNDDVHPSQIPTAQRFIGYASVQQQSAHHSALKIFLELLQPVNVVVMIFILLAHGLWEFFASLPLVYLLFFVPVVGGITLLFLAHYAIVIEEIAIEERDELPRPLRQFEFGADIFWPCANVIGAFLFSFGPAYVAWVKFDGAPLQWPAVIALMSVGFIFFPALLLTLITSGTVRNIRPDRLVGVILQSGVRYLIAVGLFPIVMIIYGFGIVGVRIALFHFMGMPIHPHWYNNPIAVFPALVIGVYMMHYFCWYLGLIYRDYHEVFPWVLQRHIPTRLLERTRT